MPIIGRLVCLIYGHPWRGNDVRMSFSDWDYMKYRCSRCGANYIRKKTDIAAYYRASDGNPTGGDT